MSTSTASDQNSGQLLRAIGYFGVAVLALNSVIGGGIFGLPARVVERALKNFILPGGHPAVSLTHFARSVCRRAERRVIGLSRREAVDPFIVVYLNRLSDLLFMLGRKLAHDLGVEEIKWEPRS